MPTLIVASSVVGGKSLNVSDLLKLSHRIPPYQRDYVWTRKVVEELWDDLITHYKKYSVSEQLPNPEGYFLGAMVVVSGGENEAFEVVDGQQRLTSLSTIITVLFDALGTFRVPEPYRSGYEQVARECLGRFVGASYETNLSFSDQDVDSFFKESCLMYKLHADKQAYWNGPWCVARLKRRNSTIYRIHEAIECGYGKLQAFLLAAGSIGSQQDRLTAFFRLVTECVVVLRITAHSHANAYSIFESLNNRGIRLSQADLIKTELLKMSLPNDREEVIDNWAFARQNIDSSEILSLPDFLHFSYLSRYSKVKANELYDSVKGILSSGGNVALAYSKEIYADAEALDALTSNFDSSWTNDTHCMLKDVMNVLGVKLCYPFLFAAYRRYSTLPTEFEKCVRLIMNFAFRYLKILDGGIEALASAVNDASMAINQGKSIGTVAGSLKTLAPDSLFEQQFETSSFVNTKLAYFVVYYIEKIRLHGALPLPHGQESNLEHIMPRTPTTTYWPHISTEKNANPELFKEYLWRIGNLLPLPADINKSIRNREIQYKIANGTGKEYSAVALNLASPKDVATFLDAGEWTYKSIDDRQKDLATKYASQAWAL